MKLRKNTGVILLILFTLAELKPVMPYLEYVINYDYIGSVLCINKDKPELECNGKCHLKEQISKVYDEKNGNEKPLIRIDSDRSPLILLKSPAYFPDPANISGYYLYPEDHINKQNLSFKPPYPPPQS